MEKGIGQIVAMVVVVIAGGCGARLQVIPDPSDTLTYVYGGGLPGAPVTSVTLHGDGRVSWSHFSTDYEKVVQNKQEGETRLTQEEASELLQAFVDAGLFDLRSKVAEGVDMGGQSVNAEIDGHTITAHFTGGSINPDIDQLLARLVQSAHIDVQTKMRK